MAKAKKSAVSLYFKNNSNKKEKIKMAVETKSLKFSKAMISRNEEGDFIVEEIKKDETVVTNLTNKLLEYLDIDGLDISISKKTETTSEE